MNLTSETSFVLLKMAGLDPSPTVPKVKKVLPEKFLLKILYDTDELKRRYNPKFILSF